MSHSFSLRLAAAFGLPSAQIFQATPVRTMICAQLHGHGRIHQAACQELEGNFFPLLRDREGSWQRNDERRPFSAVGAGGSAPRNEEKRLREEQMRALRTTMAAAFALASMVSTVRAEVSEVVLGQQFGAVYLPAMVMESEKLVEKHLAAAGMGSVKVTWAKLGGPAALNDAMISGHLHFACQGVPSMAVIWDRTRSTIGVKALGAVANNNIWLNTRNPNIKSLKDFTEKDRIAVPSLKVSTQAIMMHIAAEQTWGKGNHAKLDHIIVALPHPDALAAVTSPNHEINTHFATSPFHEGEMKAGLRTVTTAYEIMGGTMTGLTFTSHEKFRRDNPKVFEAVSKAFDESLDWINSDKRRAARLYIVLTREKRLSEDDLFALFNTKDMEYTKIPNNVGRMVDFLHSIGSVKTKPQSWKDLFFPEVHGLPGS